MLQIKYIDTLTAYIDSSDNKININKFGIKYIIVNSIPFILNVNINDEMVNPNIKHLKKQINIISGIPITDIPSKNINTNNNIFEITESLKQVR